MLVLSRRRNQSIRIGDEIEVTILEVRGERVRIGINAPREVPVMRTELLTKDLELPPRSETDSSADADTIVQLAEPSAGNDSLRTGSSRSNGFRNGNRGPTRPR